MNLSDIDPETIEFSDTAPAYPPLPEDTLAYEQYMLGGTIRALEALLDKQPAQAKSREYYDVMLQVLRAMDETITRMEALNK